MLGIELDGYSHQMDEVIKKDIRKEKRMNDLGISVLRFQDAEVYNGINNVLRAIEQYIVEREQTHPQPLSRGE